MFAAALSPLIFSRGLVSDSPDVMYFRKALGFGVEDCACLEEELPLRSRSLLLECSECLGLVLTGTGSFSLAERSVRSDRLTRSCSFSRPDERPGSLFTITVLSFRLSSDLIFFSCCRFASSKASAHRFVKIPPCLVLFCRSTRGG